MLDENINNTCTCVCKLNLNHPTSFISLRDGKRKIHACLWAKGYVINNHASASMKSPEEIRLTKYSKGSSTLFRQHHNSQMYTYNHKVKVQNGDVSNVG